MDFSDVPYRYVPVTTSGMSSIPGEMSQHANVGCELRDDISVLAGASPEPSITNTKESSDIAPPEVQPGETLTPQAMQRDQNDLEETRKPLVSTIEDCLPMESFLRGRTRQDHPWLDSDPRLGAKVTLLLNEGDRSVAEQRSPEDVWTQLETANPEHALLLVENINDEWCDALCARYPHSISEGFLLEHILGFTFDSVSKTNMIVVAATRKTKNTKTKQNQSQCVASWRVVDSVVEDISRMTQALRGRVDLLQCQPFGIHVNYWHESEPDPSDSEQCSVGDFVLRLIESEWVKSNRFISCCRLTENLYLVLHARPFLRIGWKMSVQESMCIQSHCYFYRSDVLRMPPRNHFYMVDTVPNLLSNDWPVFIWNTTVEGKEAKIEQTRLDLFLLTTSLTLRILQDETGHVRQIMGYLVYPKKMVSDQTRFANLTRSRLILARLHYAMGDFRTYLGKRGSVLGEPALVESCPQQESRYKASLAISVDSKKQPHLWKTLDNALSELQKTLDDSKKSLNEELQVAIGAVQVYDAQVAKTQTNMTVVLTILAIFYLPMTLVTGIFGMNVREISQAAGDPKAWWVAVIWAVLVVLTAGSGLLVWKVWKAWTARKARNKERDIEGGYQLEKARKALRRSPKNWGRRLKQQVNIIRRRKNE